MKAKLSFLFLPLALQAAVYQLPKSGDIIGSIQVTKVEHGETLAVISRDFEVGIEELKRANPGIKERKIPTGTEVKIPSRFILPEKSIRNGIVVNMAELRLYYFPKDKNVVYTYPVAMGRAGWRTPTTTTSVRGKTKNPTWNVPPSIREHSIDKYGSMLPEKVEPGPKNPLGKYAIYLKQKGILIHGTNNPASIGKHVSSGCIRMFNSNVGQLFSMVKVGDPVHLVHHHHKIGTDEKGSLHLESHPQVKLEQEKNFHNHVELSTKLSEHEHDADKVAQSVKESHGMPTDIS